MDIGPTLLLLLGNNALLGILGGVIMWRLNRRQYQAAVRKTEIEATKELATARQTEVDTGIKLADWYKGELKEEREQRRKGDDAQQAQIDSLIKTRDDCTRELRAASEEVDRLREFSVQIEKQMKSVLIEKRGLEGTVAALQQRFNDLHSVVEGVTRPLIDAASEAMRDAPRAPEA